MRLLGWYRQMNAARALVRMIFAIAHKIQATDETANDSTVLAAQSKITDTIGTEDVDADAEMDDVMDMELDDIAAIQAFNNRFKVDS